MEIENIQKCIVELIKKVSNKEIVEYDKNLFGAEYNLLPMDMVYICMELKHQYGIDLNWMTKEIPGYTINELVKVVEKGIMREAGSSN